MRSGFSSATNLSGESITGCLRICEKDAAGLRQGASAREVSIGIPTRQRKATGCSRKNELHLRTHDPKMNAHTIVYLPLGNRGHQYKRRLAIVLKGKLEIRPLQRKFLCEDVQERGLPCRLYIVYSLHCHIASSRWIP
ncbi:hypothetical protein LshimejAT787_0605400 [Lyophyllum shimeji]|uniref:Uncharacterized protein n=1 Tax=Lyophyllum shimeji TaxID=47721 RepID=A0A9P3PPU5_LYOSH|nr:hypothetical protein LshimejAT787_0605400 [Lyophyllum shimeji]